MISYLVDSHTLYGSAYYSPAADHAAGEKVDIHDWDSGVYLGQIPQVAHTYNVVGHINEHGLSIGESTFDGLESLAHQENALIDYGTLMFLVLQRAKTAREAITVIDTLLNTHGYASEGESFSIADRTEVWYMELIGKGPGEKGAVWVARKVPDGQVSAHANQARITTFPLNKPDECLYSSDLVAFAKRKGLYPKDAPAEKFSFADVFHPLTPLSARICEGRVWSFFRRVAPAGSMDKYTDYAMGLNLTNRMPLFVPVAEKVSLAKVMAAMRDHFEGTPMDMTKDVGAQANAMPYRWRPLTWTSGKSTYFNERAIGTYQTGYSIISQSRSWLPAPIGSLLWLGVDDTTTTVWIPLYGGQNGVPKSFAEKAIGEGINHFSFDSAFWVFNMVANLVYPRYSLVYPEVSARLAALQAQYATEIAVVDKKALDVWPTSPAQAKQILTNYSVSTGDKLTADWLEYWKYLFVRFLDGSRRQTNPDPKQPMPVVEFPGYPQPFLDKIVAETGDHYKVREAVVDEAGGYQAVTEPAIKRTKLKGI